MRLGIIGGGAAGMMAAAAATHGGADVILFDGNTRLGTKVRISGGGRCNVTTGIDSPKEVLKRYPRGSTFLSYAMHEFPPARVRAWFENHGVPLKTEQDMRVFPRSDDGDDIVGVFEDLFKKYGVQVHLGEKVEQVRLVSSTEKSEQEKFEIITAKGKYTVDKLVIATGGRAFRHTGSKGDGYAFAQSLGHHITKLAPSLNSFVVEEKWPREIAGVSFPYARLHLKGEDDAYDAEGPFIFTHRGISGPAVFTLSSLSAFEHCGKDCPLHVYIDLLPQYNQEVLFDMLYEASEGEAKKQIINALHDVLPQSVLRVMLALVKVDESRKAGEVGKKPLRELAQMIKHLPITVVGKGAGDEFVTAGGMDLEEIDPKTMQSRIIPGLYFAGEVLNIDGFTGGFNLQASWATGRLAGL